MSRECLREYFRPYHFGPSEEFVELYHVYDNQSQTPLIPDVGIQCADTNNYIMDAWHVITGKAIRRHLDWSNRRPAQFVSFYDDLATARRDKSRRIGSGKSPQAVRIAHIRLSKGTNVWFFSKQEWLSMMQAVNEPRFDINSTMGRRDWIVWGAVPADCVLKDNA